MVKLLLSDTRLYPWTQTKEIAFRGYFIVDGVLYRENDAINNIKKRLETATFIEILPDFNGVFSIVYLCDAGMYAATDRIRALPLFYAQEQEDLLISDQASILYENLIQVSFDPISIEDFKTNRLFVSGKETLYKEINQAQAGECIYWNNLEHLVSREFYFLHAEGRILQLNQEELTVEFRAVFEKACENLKLALDGKTAVVPLSGGTDSRELLLMLNSIGYKKVLCFSYGKKGNVECKIAQELAEYFGYPWIEIVYTRRLWAELRDYQYGFFLKKYFNYAGNYTSLPHIQDLLAVKILLEQGSVPSDSVFLPGHTGAIIGGALHEKFLNAESKEYNEIIETIMKMYYKNTTSKDVSRDLRNKITTFFHYELCETNAECEAQFHNFTMREWSSKYLINAIRVYEYLGFEWLLPLCDSYFLDFMKGIPLELKNNKKFIRDFMGLESIESTSDKSLYKDISGIVRRIIPLRIICRKFARLCDYFTSLTQIEGLFGQSPYMLAALKGDEHFTINELINRWYLSLLEEKNDEPE